MATTVTFNLLVLVIYMACVSSQEIASVTFAITEEEGSGIYIGNVSSLDIGATDEQKADMNYNILDNNQNIKQYLSLHDKSGMFFTTVVIDRETICPYQVDCVLKFRVGAVAVVDGSFYPIEVRIVIGDINDNVPMFPFETKAMSVSEGSTVGASFIIEGAVDKDNGRNGIQVYEISPESDAFGLNFEKNLDGSFTVQLYVKKTLDREVQDRYQLRVLARDGGSPPSEGFMEVVIQVTDVNDNKPEFSKPVYNISIEEDTDPDTIILTLYAEDKDSGPNGEVSYKISERQANAAEIINIFAVNATSGDIRVKQKLIYQADQHYSFIVEALDNGGPPKVSQAQVLVYVTDSGNNPPKVSVSLLSNGNIGFVNISENEKSDSFVAHINIEDTDTGPNGIVECTVSNNLFRVDTVTGGGFKVVVANRLNREAADLHNVTVTCHDQGTPPLSSAVSFLVRVTDYNDNAPEFQQRDYMASIYENMSQEQQILQVSATDLDIGRNKDITYEIRNQDRISIDPRSGIITVRPFFDREKEPVVVFNVLAIDRGEIPLTGYATVTLTIKDKNDNAPQFLQPIFEFEIEENLNSGTTIGQFLAKDNDIEENGKFTFSVSPFNIDNKFPFIVFADGKIQSNRELDREERSRYDFYVIVTDQGQEPLSSSVSVVVIVGDVNDNSPNITFPSKNNRSVSILYPDSPTDFVTQIKAYDLDKGENKTLTYDLISGNDLGLFRIEVNTGKVFIADKSIMIDQNLRIPLRVKVSDRGRLQNYATEDLVIDLTYTNATYAASSQSANNYVVISVVVVVVTILISAAIIGIIFLLRCFDKRKALEVKDQTDGEAGFNTKPTMYIINPAGESSTDYDGNVPGDLKKKKEVSFSEDHESINNSMIDLQLANITDSPVKFVPEKPPRRSPLNTSTDQYDKVTTRLENLKYQQYLMGVQQAKKTAQTPSHHGNPEDSRSETSGETNTDSGHGASESDGGPSTSPAHDDQKVFDYIIQSPYSKSSDNQLVPTIPRKDHSAISPPPIPIRTYKPYSSFTKTPSSYPNNSHYVSGPIYNNGPITDSARLSWQPHVYSSYPAPFENITTDYSDYSSLPSYFRGSVKSRDDDDCSTTTSGSYTLQEDLL